MIYYMIDKIILSFSELFNLYVFLILKNKKFILLKNKFKNNKDKK